MPITSINEEFCFCFLLVAGLIMHFNGRCSEIIRAAADEPRGVVCCCCSVAWPLNLPSPLVCAKLSMVESHVPYSLYFGEAGEKKRNGFCCPQWSCPGVHLWVRELDSGHCSGAVGPVGIDAAVSLPAVLSAAEAANREGGNEGWEAAELPPAPSTPSPPAPGANALCEQRKRRSALQLLLLPSSSSRKKWLM